MIGDVLANRGPLFYRQAHVGQGGRTFEMTKFRTIRGDVDGGGESGRPSVMSTRHAVRSGCSAHTHLDELPQVLTCCGASSAIVGPRPEQPQVVAEFTDKIPFYGLRHLVRPGLTGWAQVKFRYAGSESETLEKLQYEFFYLRRQSLALDLRIVFRTVRIVLGRKGR